MAISITGSGFESTDTVSLGGVAATGVNVVSPSQIDATTPALPPGTLNDLVVTKLNLSSAQLSKAFLADFLDVPQSDGFHDYVEKILRSGKRVGQLGALGHGELLAEREVSQPPVTPRHPKVAV